MNYLENVEKWGNTHHPKWMDILRIILGLFLCWKGIDFLQNQSLVTGPLSTKTSFGSFSVIMLTHYVTFAHLVGGLLMVLGLFTRFACIIQIPILLGAIIFIQFASDVFKPYDELFLTVIILLLLINFLIIGNGPWAIKLPEEKKRIVQE